MTNDALGWTPNGDGFPVQAAVALQLYYTLSSPLEINTF